MSIPVCYAGKVFVGVGTFGLHTCRIRKKPTFSEPNSPHKLNGRESREGTVPEQVQQSNVHESAVMVSEGKIYRAHTE